MKSFLFDGVEIRRNITSREVINYLVVMSGWKVQFSSIFMAKQNTTIYINYLLHLYIISYKVKAKVALQRTMKSQK